MNGKIRFRALIVGILFGLGICAFTPYNNGLVNNADLAGGHFPMAPFFIAVWLFLISALHARITRGTPLFTGMEVMTSWVIMALCAGVAATGLTETFLVNITAPVHFTDDAYRWTETLRPLLPESWYPWDKEAITALYDGLDGGREMGWLEVLGHIPWAVWVGPLLTWGVFILGSYFTAICIVSLFGRQWVVNERVNFPLLRVPGVMAESLDAGDFGKLLTNKYLLWGVFTAAGLHLINGLHFYSPSVPEIPTMVLAGKYFPKYGLFTGFYNKLNIHIIPAFIGFAFLTSRQVSFSLWFFYLFGGLLYGILYVLGLQIPEAALGAVFGPNLSKPVQAQAIGAYGVFALFLLWLARAHLGLTLRETIIVLTGRGKKRDTPCDDVPGEWKPSILPLLGTVLGLAFLTGWCRFFGLPWLAALIVPPLFFLVMVVAARIVCQGGLAHFTLTAAPTDGITGLFGTGIMGKTGILAVAVMQKVLFLDFKEAAMPTLFHGEKVVEKATCRRRYVTAIGVGLALAVAVSMAAMLATGYKYGFRVMDLDWAANSTLSVYQNAQGLIDVSSGPNGWMIGFAGAGALFTFLLIFMYYRFPWWPLHPLGYLAAYSASMKIIWFSMFLGWLCNHLTLHYGGTALYNRLRYLFIGLVAGEFLMGGVWALIGLWAESSYHVFPF